MYTIQDDAISAVLAEVKKCPEVKAAFIKGSLATGSGDEYSDVDFYCLVEEEGLQTFLDKRMQVLEKHRPLLYHSHSNFVGPQIVAVFDNGLHFDLYTVTPDKFPLVGEFKALYDPENLLEAYTHKTSDHSISWEQVEEHFNSFSFTMLEFNAAWQRGDVAWSSRLASHLAGDLGILLRHRYDPQNAQLGTKRLEKVLPSSTRQELREALSCCCGENTVQGVLALSMLVADTTRHLEGRHKRQVTWALFTYMTKLMRSTSNPS